MGGAAPVSTGLNGLGLGLEGPPETPIGPPPLQGNESTYRSHLLFRPRQAKQALDTRETRLAEEGL